MRNDLQIPLIMNIGSCFLKKKDFHKAINLYTSVNAKLFSELFYY